MDDEIVCGKMLGREQLAMLLAQCAFLQDGTFLGEKVPHQIVLPQERDALLCFERFNAEQSYNYARYTTGRIFHPNFELRWQHEQDGARVIYVGVERDVPFLEPIPALKLVRSKQQQSYYLFGKRLGDRAERIGAPAAEGDFAEARIPRLLCYPIRGKQPYAQLIVREYLDSETGQIAFHRFVAVEGAK